MALSWTLDKIGPLARSADDCGLVLDAIAGPDSADPSTMPTTYRYDGSRQRTRGFRIGVLRQDLDSMQPAVRSNFEESLHLLSDLGSLDDVDLPDFPYADLAMVIFRVEAAAAMEELAERGDLAKLTAAEDRTGAFAGAFVPAVDYLRAMRIRRKVDHALDDLFAQYDAIVAPTTAVVASPLTMNFDAYAGTLRRLTIGAAGNLAGLPAISLPNGFGERGLPTAFQVVGRVGGENTVLALGRAVQEMTEWHRRNPIV
jgi:aspartyl-tRNA(Asn)/glutamyl-tRNA(Gln) amidotransferase subunit A